MCVYVFERDEKDNRVNTYLGNVEFPERLLIISHRIIPPNKLNKSPQAQTCSGTAGLPVL